MAVSTASIVYCPKCGHRTNTYCGATRGTVKVRYRKCPKCEHRLKTLQQLNGDDKSELIVPVVTPEEQAKLLSDARKRQAGRRAAMNQIKLTVREVAEIKYLVHNKIQTQSYTAMQYGVEKTAIHRIATGACFSDVQTPKSLADL